MPMSLSFNEIVMILEQLAADGQRRDLVSCSAVCRQWSTEARRVLYRNIKYMLQAHSGLSSIEQHVATVDNVGSYIVHLTITGPPRAFAYTRPPADCDVAESQLMQLVDQLPRLKHLHLARLVYSTTSPTMLRGPLQSLVLRRMWLDIPSQFQLSDASISAVALDVILYLPAA